MFSAFYREMLKEGIYLAPSQFEALFVSSAHGDDHIMRTIEAAWKVMQRLSR
jgi:glutamate-1-semialdehyde 2,1-aminomutase